MAVKKFENKSVNIGKNKTGKKNHAIIETKKRFCFPEHGRTVTAKNREEAEKIIKNI